MRPDFPQGRRQLLVLARVRGELAQDLARPHGPGGHGGRHPQDVRPVSVDQVHVHLAADQRAQALRDARALEHVEALRGQVPDARDERVAEDRARGEDVVGEAAGVGVLFADAPSGLVHQEPVEDVGRFVDGGRDGLGGERGESVGDVRVRLDAGFGPVPGVDQVERFTPAAGREELAVAGGGPPRCPRRRPSVVRPGPRRRRPTPGRTRRLSTCQRAMRISSQNPCVVVASAILRRPRLMPSASSTLSRPMRSRQGSPVRRCVKASVNRVASSTSRRMSVIRASGIRR